MPWRIGVHLYSFIVPVLHLPSQCFLFICGENFGEIVSYCCLTPQAILLQ